MTIIAIAIVLTWAGLCLLLAAGMIVMIGVFVAAVTPRR